MRQPDMKARTATPQPLIARVPRALPADAFRALQRAVAHFGTQVAVARVLGISAAAVNQALKGTYRGDVDGIEQRIRGALMAVTVVCPVIGEISTKQCLDEQRRPMVFTNPLRVRLHRACKTCPHRKDAKEPTPLPNPSKGACDD